MAVALTVPGAARAMPNYDVAEHCRNVSAVIGGSETIRRQCIIDEQRAYDRVKATWHTIPAAMRAYCDSVGEVIGGSYVILQECIRGEMRAASSIPTFRR